MVTAAALMLTACAAASPAAAARKSSGSLFDSPFGARILPPKKRAGVHAAKIPLPRPRPEEAPRAGASAHPARAAPQASPDKPAEAAGEPPKPSACRQALTADIAIAPSVPDIHGPGECGGEDLVRLEAVVLAGGAKVKLQPPAILRCKMATEVVAWVRSDVAPLASSLGGALSDLDNFDSFECRGRNRANGATLSEHGRANALDVRGFRLSSGQQIPLTDRTVPRDVRESVLHSACSRFTTVLGPGSDGYHEDHIHLDLMERRSNYRICQWDVWDPLPQVAPLLPAERPEGAPPREVAGKADEKPDDNSKGKPDANAKSKPDRAARSDTKHAEDAGAPAKQPVSAKKRRGDRRF
jgi:hypothetical protein